MKLENIMIITKEDNDWEEIWEKNLMGEQHPDEIKLFIQQTLQEQKKKWQKERSGWNELKQCPQCHTMKVFTTKVCYSCKEKNDIKEELIKRIKNEFQYGSLRESFEEYFPKDREASEGIRPSLSNRSGALAYLADIQNYLRKLDKEL